jgi:hypothetical protein
MKQKRSRSKPPRPHRTCCNGDAVDAQREDQQRDQEKVDKVHSQPLFFVFDSASNKIWSEQAAMRPLNRETPPPLRNHLSLSSLATMSR